MKNKILISTCYFCVIGVLFCGCLLDSQYYISCLILIGIFVGWLALFYKANKRIINQYICRDYEDYDKDICNECIADCNECFYKKMYYLNHDFSLENKTAVIKAEGE